MFKPPQAASGVIGRTLVLSFVFALGIAAGAAHAFASTPLAEAPGLARYLFNSLNQLIAFVFFVALLYGAFQAAGAARIGRLLAAPTKAASRWSRLWLWPSARRWPLGASPERCPINRAHELEERMLPLEYAVWVLPMLGFAGTVIGITDAIEGLGQMFTNPGDLARQGETMARVMEGLHYAFDTTLVGLALVIPLRAFAAWVEINEKRVGACLEHMAAAAAPTP